MSELKKAPRIFRLTTQGYGLPKLVDEISENFVTNEFEADDLELIEYSAYQELLPYKNRADDFKSVLEENFECRKLIGELQARCEKLKSTQKEVAILMDGLVWACDNHLSSVGMTFSSKTILREKLEAIQAWIETREALASKETMNGK